MYIGCLFEYSPQEKWPAQVAGPRLSSKQTIFCLGSNRNKLKRDLFRFYFGLFREIIKNKILVLFRCFETNRNKKSVFRNKPKLKINTVLCNGHGHWSGHDFLFRFEPKRTKLDLGLFRESKKNSNWTKNGVSNKPKLKINNLLLCNGHGRGNGHDHFYFVRVFFELSLGVSVKAKHETSCFDIKAKQPKQTSAADSAETSFGSSLTYIETKQAS
jgi:hypothetical protein